MYMLGVASLVPKLIPALFNCINIDTISTYLHASLGTRLRNRVQAWGRGYVIECH